MNRPLRWCIGWAAVCLAAVQPVWAGFTITSDGRDITIAENGKTVLQFRMAPVSPPADRSSAAPHTCYIHPIIDGYGNTLTEDFPLDHLHHRGLFWAWPEIEVNGKTVSTWLLEGAHTEFERNVVHEQSETHAVIGLQNAWVLDETGTAFMMEDVMLTLYASTLTERSMDIALRLRNVTNGPVSLHGASTDGKGYGGLTFRPDAALKPFEFYSARGRETDDAFTVPSPWADISFRLPRSSRFEGVTIMQHPDNPGYPHDGWMLRHYGLLVASWPGNSTVTLAPGEAFELRYRILIHPGSGGDIALDKIYSEYIDSLNEPEAVEPKALPKGID